MLEVKNITVSFDNMQILSDFNLEVAKEEILGIIGPSGSGKSTILKVIAGLIVPDRGTVEKDGVDISKTPTHLRNIGMVFQDNQLFPHMNVEKNILFGLHSRNLSKYDRDLKVSEMLELVGLSGFEKRKTTDLSGGEAKRVALARSLSPNPSVLLLDEPLTGLDKELHDQLMVDLSELLRRTKTTAILVTHDKNEALTITDRILSIS